MCSTKTVFGVAADTGYFLFKTVGLRTPLKVNTCQLLRPFSVVRGQHILFKRKEREREREAVSVASSTEQSRVNN